MSILAWIAVHWFPLSIGAILIMWFCWPLLRALAQAEKDAEMVMGLADYPGPCAQRDYLVAGEEEDMTFPCGVAGCSRNDPACRERIRAYLREQDAAEGGE